MTRREKLLTWIATATTLLSGASFAVALRAAGRTSLDLDRLAIGDKGGWVTLDATPDGGALEIGSPHGTSRWEADADGARATLVADNTKFVFDASGDRARITLNRDGTPVLTIDSDAGGVAFRLAGTGGSQFAMRVDDLAASFTMGTEPYTLSARTSPERASVTLAGPEERVDLVAQASAARFSMGGSGAGDGAIDLAVGSEYARFGARGADASLDLSVDDAVGSRLDATRAGHPWNLCADEEAAR